MGRIIISKRIVEQGTESSPGNRDATGQPQAEQQPTAVLMVRQDQSGKLLLRSARVRWQLHKDQPRQPLRLVGRLSAKRFSATDVVALVIISILTGSRVIEPCRVRLVPTDCATNAFFE